MITSSVSCNEEADGIFCGDPRSAGDDAKAVLDYISMQTTYFRSLPLHKSQEEVETHEDYSVFSYFLITDYYFKQDLQSFGKEVKVLKPDSLRKEFAEIVEKIHSKYH